MMMPKGLETGEKGKTEICETSELLVHFQETAIREKSETRHIHHFTFRSKKKLWIIKHKNIVICIDDLCCEHGQSSPPNHQPAQSTQIVPMEKHIVRNVDARSSLSGCVRRVTSTG